MWSPNYYNMFIEERKSGKNIKYYLVHSYRDENNKVRKIRRYLGSNLSQKQLDNLKKRAEELINQQINELKTDIFEFSLSQKEISKLNKYNDKIEIVHLDKKIGHSLHRISYITLMQLKVQQYLEMMFQKFSEKTRQVILKKTRQGWLQRQLTSSKKQKKIYLCHY